MAINYKQCPKCGSKNTIKIIYGEPSYELFQEAEAGNVRLGGCCIDIGSPEYFCKDCEYEWNRDESIDSAYRKIKKIKVLIGDCFGESNEVEIDLQQSNVTWSFNKNFFERVSCEKFIKKKAVEQFSNQLKKVDLLNWKSKYTQPVVTVLDGLHWRVEVYTDSRTIKKCGENEYPKEWKLFCRVIEQIAGKKLKFT